MNPSPASGGQSFTSNAPVTSNNAEVGDPLHRSITEDLLQLSHDDLDVRRWVNTTLQHLMSTKQGVKQQPANIPSDDLESDKHTSQQMEQLVQLLHTRVQAHAKELSTHIEDTISQTLIRLPRTTLELNRMSTEAGELAEQLKAIQGVVQPAVMAGGETYVEELHKKVKCEEKLRRCTEVLEKAAHVDESIRSIQYMVEQFEVRQGFGREDKGVPTRPSTQRDKQDSKADQQHGLDEVAGLIRQAHADLNFISTVDEHFSEQYKTQLEQYEHFIEQALEVECLDCLAQHHVEQSARLITTLHNIGHASAVLQQYTAKATQQLAESHHMALDEVVTASGGNAPIAAITAVLQSQIIPQVNQFLVKELHFLWTIIPDAWAAEDGANSAAGVVAVTAAAATSGAAKGVDLPVESPTTAAATAATSAAASSASRHSVVYQVMCSLVDQLYEPVATILAPLLTSSCNVPARSAENADVVACFTAIQGIKIGATTATPTSPSSSSAGTAKDAAETLARQVTTYARQKYVSLFRSDEVVQYYSKRLCQPLDDLCRRPLSQLLRDTVLLDAIMSAAEGVLCFVADKLTTRCTAAWYTTLSGMLQQLNTTAEVASSPVAQSELLHRLCLCKRRLRPTFTETQQRIDDWLTSSVTQERYPSGASGLRAAMQGTVWNPLKRDLDNVQQRVEQLLLYGITRPIQDTTSSYMSLPCWGTPPATAQARSGTALTAVQAVGNPSVMMEKTNYSQGQVAPSAPVHQMGERLMELPLTLETLYTAPQQHSSSNLTDSYDREVIRELVEEQAEDWLANVVRAVIIDFLNTKVLPLDIWASSTPAASPHHQQSTNLNGSKSAAQAISQLITDLDYVRSILCAVNEESLETVEVVLNAVRTLPISAMESGQKLNIGTAIGMPMVSPSN